MPAEKGQTVAWLPDLLYTGGRFERGLALVCDAAGHIVKIAGAGELSDEKKVHLSNRAMLPGMINAHSHAFQRVLRGRTEFSGELLSSGGSPTLNGADSFWTWREMMYSAATHLTPEDIYEASRMAFLEMALSGITAVGEFHYLHHAPDGVPYDDPNLLATEVVRAARDVGLRIALLRVAYARSGYQTEANPKQQRFIERDSATYLKNLERLIADVTRGTSPTVRAGSSSAAKGGALPDGRANAPHAAAWAGVAPHSVRAVPLDYLREVVAYANEHQLKIHMHVAEQPAEVSACVEEYGRTPIALLDTEGLLSERFTAVHAIHVTPKAIPSLARAGASVCACPTTERNLGDGVVPADEYFEHGVTVCLGTDSHAQIDLLEDARELEYHLRLQKLERAVLDCGDPTVREGAFADEIEKSTLPNGRVSAIARRLFECATVNGARSIGASGGVLEAGKPADFFTVALDDPTIAGASSDNLLSSIVFASTRAAVREVVVGGKPIVSAGQHLIQDDVIERFNDLQKRLWS
ncbi:MAG TPA: formimidoylglutamate deiminase [Pyrinomonadaceae bacterium]|nr:formimidoylglutamate deiminase [Pyrinomonadaceae bacterium]